MPFIPPEQLAHARKMDLLTYLRCREPEELISVGGNTYATKSHDSLKISNGEWYWWSRGVGGSSALDYLTTVRKLSLPDAVQRIAALHHKWRGFVLWGNCYFALPLVICVQRLIAASADTMIVNSQKLLSSVLTKEMTAKAACAAALTTKYHFRARGVHVIFFCFRPLNACSTAKAIAACTRMVITMKAIRTLRM